MSISREHILDEVKRTAAKNGGMPLGRTAFTTETGIREGDWSGRYWARWGDVLKEAGFAPNKLREAIEPTVLLNRFAQLSLELGRILVQTELRLKKRMDASFPNDGTYDRFGKKAEFLLLLRSHCLSRPEYAAVLPLIKLDLEEKLTPDTKKVEPTELSDGYVYLVKMGKHYKIGKTFSIPRRHRELSLELPEKLTPIHVIRTDDPSGIEAYWHKRFQAKATNGEWFALSLEDIRIFKKRKFM